MRFYEYHRNYWDGYTDVFFEDDQPNNLRRDYALTKDTTGSEPTYYATIRVSPTDDGDFGDDIPLPQEIVNQLKEAAGFTS